MTSSTSSRIETSSIETGSSASRTRGLHGERARDRDALALARRRARADSARGSARRGSGGPPRAGARARPRPRRRAVLALVQAQRLARAGSAPCGSGSARRTGPGRPSARRSCSARNVAPSRGRHGLAVEQDPAARRTLLPGEQLGDRRLARPALTDERDDGGAVEAAARRRGRPRAPSRAGRARSGSPSRAPAPRARAARARRRRADALARGSLVTPALAASALARRGMALGVIATGLHERAGADVARASSPAPAAAACRRCCTRPSRSGSAARTGSPGGMLAQVGRGARDPRELAGAGRGRSGTSRAARACRGGRCGGGSARPLPTSTSRPA